MPPKASTKSKRKRTRRVYAVKLHGPAKEDDYNGFHLTYKDMEHVRDVINEKGRFEDSAVPLMFEHGAGLLGDRHFGRVLEAHIDEGDRSLRATVEARPGLDEHLVDSFIHTGGKKSVSLSLDQHLDGTWFDKVVGDKTPLEVSLVSNPDRKEAVVMSHVGAARAEKTAEIYKQPMAVAPTVTAIASAPATMAEQMNLLGGSSQTAVTPMAHITPAASMVTPDGATLTPASHQGVPASSPLAQLANIHAGTKRTASDAGTVGGDFAAKKAADENALSARIAAQAEELTRLKAEKEALEQKNATLSANEKRLNAQQIAEIEAAIPAMKAYLQRAADNMGMPVNQAALDEIDAMKTAPNEAMNLAKAISVAAMDQAQSASQMERMMQENGKLRASYENAMAKMTQLSSGGSFSAPQARMQTAGIAAPEPVAQAPPVSQQVTTIASGPTVEYTGLTRPASLGFRGVPRADRQRYQNVNPIWFTLADAAAKDPTDLRGDASMHTSAEVARDVHGRNAQV